MVGGYATIPDRFLYANAEYIEGSYELVRQISTSNKPIIGTYSNVNSSNNLYTTYFGAVGKDDDNFIISLFYSANINDFSTIVIIVSRDDHVTAQT